MSAPALSCETSFARSITLCFPYERNESRSFSVCKLVTPNEAAAQREMPPTLHNPPPPPPSAAFAAQVLRYGKIKILFFAARRHFQVAYDPSSVIRPSRPSSSSTAAARCRGVALGRSCYSWVKSRIISINSSSGLLTRRGHLRAEKGPVNQGSSF